MFPDCAPSATMRRRVALTSLVLLALTAALRLSDLQQDRQAGAQVLTAHGQLRWYRGNLHTHSLWSDGDDFLENIAWWYREHGYHFLCITDHNVLPRTERWIDLDQAKSGRKAYERLKRLFPQGLEERQLNGSHYVRLRRFDEVQQLVGREDFLLLQGEEITDKFGKLPVHLNVTNVQDLLPPMGGQSVVEVLQNNVDAVIAQRERTRQPMLVHVNHPNFGWALTAEDLMRVRGENFFEVYNGHPGVHNSGDQYHASTERLWDIMLTWRIAKLNLPLMYGLGTDDGHSYHRIPSRDSEPGRAWVMVLAAELTPEAIVAALEAGRFYSSSGVTLTTIKSSPEGLEIEIQAEPGVTYTTEFIGSRAGVSLESQPVVDQNGQELPVTRRYDPAVGAVLATVNGPRAQYRFRGDELYVRARVQSSRLHPNPSEVGDYECAWVQPVLGPGAK